MDTLWNTTLNLPKNCSGKNKDSSLATGGNHLSPSEIKGALGVKVLEDNEDTFKANEFFSYRDEEIKIIKPILI